MMNADIRVQIIVFYPKTQNHHVFRTGKENEEIT